MSGQLPPVDLLQLLDLERIERDIFRASTVFREEYALYGGQVAAQALVAAGRTVEGGRLPHSLHGYFLRPGASEEPVVFRVDRDRDGRSFSARRVVAVQQGKVIFNMACSFHVDVPGGLDAAPPAPQVPAAGDLPPGSLPRLASMDVRLPPQPYAQRARYPTRFWARPTVALPADPLVHAAALTYLSDISTGVLPAPDGGPGPSASLDHAVWFHDVPDMARWTLFDHQPGVAGRGRGWYTGSLFAPGGRLVASVAQECLYR